MAEAQILHLKVMCHQLELEHHTKGIGRRYGGEVRPLEAVRVPQLESSKAHGNSMKIEFLEFALQSLDA